MRLVLSEKWVVALNFVLIAGCAYFAARSVNRIIADRLAAPPPGATAQEVRHKAPALSRSAYNLIVSRDIFNAAPPPAPVVKVPVATNLHLTLLGTSHLTQAKPYAVIEDQSTHEQSLYRLGDNIPKAGRLVRVEKTRVLIEHDGKTVALEIPTQSLASPPAPKGWMRQSNREARARTKVREVARNEYVINRSTVDHNLQNMGQLFTQMRALPNLENGHTQGFKLSEIVPGSLFQQMGLRDGDVITAVNGQPLDDPTQAISLFNNLRNANSISVTMLRGGRTMQLNYDIR